MWNPRRHWYGNDGNYNWHYYNNESPDWNVYYPFPQNFNYYPNQVVQNQNGNVWRLVSVGKDGTLYWVLVQAGPNSSFVVGATTTTTGGTIP